MTNLLLHESATADQILPLEDEVHWFLLCVLVCCVAEFVAKNLVEIVKVGGYASPAGRQESFFEIDAESASKPFLYDSVRRANNCSNDQRV